MNYIQKEHLKEYAHNLKQLKKYAMNSTDLYSALDNLHYDEISEVNELNEIQILNLINEKLYNIAHDGETEYRGIMNAENLELYINKDKGINCLMTAIYIQDKLWEFGIKSVLMQGNPCEYTYRDSHWFLRVYCKKTEKWFFADPVWKSYVYDEDGTILDIIEIYNKLLNGDKIFFPKERLFEKYNYLLIRYFFSLAVFKYQGIGVFEKKYQQKIYLSSKEFDIISYVSNKEKDRFLPFDIKEYLFFSRHEEVAIFKCV